MFTPEGSGLVTFREMTRLPFSDSLTLGLVQQKEYLLVEIYALFQLRLSRMHGLDNLFFIDRRQVLRLEFRGQEVKIFCGKKDVMLL